jgi:hypothetical protein
MDRGCDRHEAADTIDRDGDEADTDRFSNADTDAELTLGR